VGIDTLRSWRVKIFADGADAASMAALARQPFVSGFTTNPTLMRKAGVQSYRAFARAALAAVPDKPISFEVFADDAAGMERQAREIASWGRHVYVKIPVTNTAGTPTRDLVRRLSGDGVQVNVTAVMTLAQIEAIADALADGAPSCVSLFAGRIADTGRDPVPYVRRALEILRAAPRAELIWASPRELFNIVQANEVGCHIITVTSDVLAKLALVGKDLDEYSLETVRMFFTDAQNARFSLD
jgi:transaldolase